MEQLNKSRVTLTSDDVPTLKRLERFFEARKDGHGFVNHFASTLTAVMINRLVRHIELRGQFSSDERVDKNGVVTRR